MTQSSFKENINVIKEIYPGVYQVILDFASKNFIELILNDQYDFLWFHNYNAKNSIGWKECEMPISTHLTKKVIARQISYDFIIPTKEYNEIKDEIPNGVTIIQIRKSPPDFLDLKRLKGKTRYDLLKKECDFLFEIDLPNSVDYGTLVSKDLDFLKGLLNNENINWEDLP
ncbi:hypothetical protein [Carboxylicivirga marina]|uniref:IPExxxVDY family protein n=1 Tax=Carboxylicivirga marina TaxID=2800988 RepID=A0ABS1HQ49_9BACT|nr:hypothetical protein [Carboxylicivirga marina]MBK3519615.1 hypothetical protein [Carboxylicivirga marina]